MTEKFNRYRIKTIDRSTFGGIIYKSDFDTNRHDNITDGSDIANRIISDMKFDEQCRKNVEYRDKNKNAEVSIQWQVNV